ncbi:MAG TPA: TonB-dependent receptor [Opitutaceae bacterium]
MSFSRLLPVLATASLATAQVVPPEHTHDEPVALENVVVTAHPYGRSQADLAQPTNVLAGRALALHQSNSLGELLSDEVGVSSTYFGPGASRPVIRGLGGDRVRVLTNSVGSIDASVTSPDHAVALDPLLIERVEVVRGPATLLYGNSAVGGVVNVIDHRIHTTLPESPFNSRAELRVNSVNDEHSFGAVAEGGAGRFAWHLDGYRRDAEDVRIPGFAESARLRAEEAEEAAEHGEAPPEEISGRIPNTALNADGGAAGFSFIGERGYIGLSYSGHNTLYGVPAGAHAHQHEEEDAGAGEEAPAAEEEDPVRIDLRQRRVDLQGELTQPFAIFRGAKFKLGVARYRHQELEGGEIGTVFTNRGYDGRLELLHEQVGPVTGAFGVQSSRSDFEAIGAEAFVPPSRTENGALFLFEEAELKPVTLQFGARYETQDIALRDGSGISRDGDSVSLSAGVVWALAESWSLSASLSRNERQPSAQELYSNGPHIGTAAFELGDPGLGKEKSVGLDVSLRKRAGFVTGALTGFVNRFDGFIYEQPTGGEEDGLTVYQYVQRDAEFYGAELETILHLHESAAQQLDLTLGADLVRARNTSDDTDLPRITPQRTKVGLAWVRGPYSAGGEVQFVAAQDRVAPNETPTDRYALVSAYAGYRFALGRATYDVFVRGSNLTDEEARLHTSFLKEVAPLPGRGITVALRASF